MIVIAASANDSTTSGLYAYKAGLFKKAGLNVRFTPMSSGAAVAAAVAGGSVQIGSSSLINMISAHAKHIPFTLVGTSAMYSPGDAKFVGLVVAKDSPYRTARDLDGKTFAVPGLKDLNTVAAMAWLDRNGGDSSTVRFVEMPSEPSLQAVIGGRIDATILTTPFLTQGLATGKLRELSDGYGAIAREYIELAWFTTDDYASKNPDVIVRFSRVMHDAAVYCNAHQAETVDMIAELAKLDPAVVRTMPRVQFAPYLSAALIQPLVDAAAKYKVIDAPFNAQELISPYAEHAR